MIFLDEKKDTTPPILIPKETRPCLPREVAHMVRINLPLGLLGYISSLLTYFLFQMGSLPPNNLTLLRHLKENKVGMLKEYSKGSPLPLWLTSPFLLQREENKRKIRRTFPPMSKRAEDGLVDVDASKK